jgi:lipopolysaccharide export system permease protein
VRDFRDGSIERYEKFPATALSELSEPPSYFNREVLQASQLSFRQLGSYIEELHQAGFDVSALTVQWYVKIAFPLIAPVSMLLAIPYAFRFGARGALGGVAVGLAVGIAYFSLARLLEAMGGVGQMPPPFAAFAPDLIFYFFGMYFFFKMPT